MAIAAPQAVAVPVADLYVADVLVADREGDTGLTAGARAGLLQVLVRVSGSTAVEQHPLVRDALRDPSRYYYQYGYDSSERTLMVDGEEQPARVLRLSFEPSSIARLLRNAGFPVWGSNRPGVLVWIAVTDADGRRVLTESDDHRLLAALEHEARARGLPLLYPILDLEDTARLSTAEVWGLFTDRIDVASMRYGPDVVLAGRVQGDAEDVVRGRWMYRIEARWEQFDNTGESMLSVVAGIVDRLADELADRYAVGSSRSEVMLWVEGVDGLDDYANLEAYLQSLAPVVDSYVVEVDEDQVLFRLRTEGQVRQLREIIDLDEKLVFISDGDALRFRWLSD